MIYRLLTGDDNSEFCQKVSKALATGWQLHGGPCYAFDGEHGVMRCAQAVVKESDDADQSDMKLGDR